MRTKKSQRKTTLNKKGSVLDVIFIVVALFAFVMILYVTHNFWTDLSDDMTGSGGVFENDNTSKDIMHSGTKTVNSFNWLFVFALVLLVIVTVILASLQEITPGTILVAVLIVAILTIIAGYLGTAFQDFSSDPEFLNESGTYTAPTVVMNNFGGFAFIIGMLVVVVMFVLYRRRQQ